MDSPSTCKPTDEEVRAFIGPRADRYLRKWRWYIDNGTGRAGTLWPPFFFNFIWFLYRRMYREVWIPIVLALAVGIVLGAVEGFVEARSGIAYSMPRPIETGVNVGLGFATSWLGSLLYFRKLRRKVAEARSQGLDSEAVFEFLRRCGGTSPTGAIVGTVLAAVATLLALALAG